MKLTISKALEKVEKLAKASKLGRLMHHPYRYLAAYLFRKLSYPKNKEEWVVEVPLFFGKNIHIALPAATDIYLTGGKSHDSEIRLAKFLIKNLEAGHHFLDIGAHYGYFSMLAAELVGPSGKIVAIEPASKSYKLLAQNMQAIPCATALQKAVSKEEGVLKFYEFPNQYSEYNTTDITQFEGEAWFKASPPRCVEVPTTTIDKITAVGDFLPKVIKIDVEGAEFLVMQGASHYLSTHKPTLVMEYLEPARHNESHSKALELLKGFGYNSFVIKSDGSLESIENIDLYLEQNKLESDNIVFK
jgi:FkbM family methyltransferase